MLSRILLAYVTCWTLFAQQPPAPAEETQPFPIRVEVNEVIVPVTVTDQDGRFVTNLGEDDFKIYDQGIEQEIEYFNRERNQPVVIGFLIEQSNAQRLRWKTFSQMAEELVLALMPEDDRFSGYLISYSNEAELLVDTTQDPSEILEKIRKMKPGGGSALFDAIYMACTSRELVKGEPIEPRRVLIVVGDGHDNTSSKTLEEVLEIAQRNLVTIYAVSTVSYEFHGNTESNLVKLATETGGQVEYPMDDIYDDVSGHLSKPSDDGNYALTVGTGGYASHVSAEYF